GVRARRRGGEGSGREGTVPTVAKLNGGVPWIPASWRHRGIPVIPNRWLSESRHVGRRFVHRQSRGGAIPLGLGLRGCATGRTTRSSATRSETSQIDRRRRRRGCAGPPRHEICTASLDNRPPIDGFVRAV